MKNVFVLGLDDANLETLRALPDPDLQFHQLLTVEQLRHGETIPVKELLEKSRAELEAFAGDIDAIIGYWDFPVTQMVPILCSEFGLPSPTLESVLKCEHKYWSRLEQSQVIDEYPGFGLIKPEDNAARLPSHLHFPVWLKPVKSWSSSAAHLVEDEKELSRVLEEETPGMSRVAEPFSYVLSLANLPEKIASVGADAFMVEEQATGHQVTVEGFCTEERVEVYGVVDSVMYPESPSFLRYQYPSRLDSDVTDWMADVSRRIMSHIGLTRSTFNIEFFWDADRKDLKIIEINPRESQSHAKLFQLVDGLPNHKCMVDLALGRTPRMTQGQGPYRVAAKWFPRRFDDGLVTRHPSDQEIRDIERTLPGTSIVLAVHRGDRLSELPDQDSYSFELGSIDIGAADEDELAAKYERCVELLRFEFAD